MKRWDIKTVWGLIGCSVLFISCSASTKVLRPSSKGIRETVATPVPDNGDSSPSEPTNITGVLQDPLAVVPSARSVNLKFMTGDTNKILAFAEVYNCSASPALEGKADENGRFYFNRQVGEQMKGTCLIVSSTFEGKNYKSKISIANISSTAETEFKIDVAQ